MPPVSPALPAVRLRLPAARLNSIPRPRLTSRLGRAPLTLISAPAGYGKTTLVSEFVQQLTARTPGAYVGWVSLDIEDDDPVIFFIDFLSALQTAVPAFAARLALLKSSEPPPLKVVLAGLADEISNARAQITLVLDDYHLVTAAPVHTALVDLLQHPPDNLHLILTTRIDPSFPLARWRASDQLIEIRADDLRFSSTEAAAFLGQVMRLPDLSADQVSALELRTEGWPAGLQLAALSLQGRAEIGGFTVDFSGSHRFVADYLVEEVWRRQPPAIREFLLRTSILDRLSAPLCAAVLGEAQPPGMDAAAVLAELESANLFLFPLDAQRRWYRYHQLWAEAMRAQLERTDPDFIPALHRRAGKWHEQEGEVDEAIRHALAARDFEQAACLIETRSPWWVRNEVGTLTRWLAAMPETVIRSRPRLMFNHVWSLVTNSRVDEAEAWLSDIARVLDSLAGTWSPRAIQHNRAEHLAIRSSIARNRRQPAEAIRFGQEALALMDPAPSDLRAVTALHLGNAYLFHGDLDEAAEILRDAVETSLASGHSSGYLSAQHSLALIQMMRGRMRAAEALYLDARRYVDQQPRPIYSGLEAIGLAEVVREWNDFPRAEAVLAEGIALAEGGGSAAQIRLGYLAAARLKQSQGRWADGEAWLERAAHLTFDPNSANAVILTISRARLALARGEVEEAARWMQRSPSPAGGPPFMSDMAYAALARIRMASADPASAGKILSEWRESAAAGGRAGRVMEAELLLAVLDWKLGRPAAALTRIGAALAQAAPEGYVRLFVEEGETMFTLLDAVRRQAPAALIPYLQKLIGTFAAPETDPKLPEPLSAREIEVLQLLAEGRSYQEIAQTLVLAVSTVQGYIRTLYRKIGAHSGREAVARGRALKIIL